MSDLNEESVKVLSRLCRIEVSEEELSDLFADLKRILDYVGQLQEVEVNHLSPHSHIEEQSIDSLREDIVGERLPREVFLANAPDQVGGMIRFPPVMKQAP
jgi:aspartyl-tRNA(Asn)/glutamyl-tRNA(Gln) amidotransferase subunit C